MPRKMQGAKGYVTRLWQSRRAGARLTMRDTDFDAAIVGGGLVGLSLACALRDSGLRIVLVDRGPPPAGRSETPAPDDWDARVYAVSPGSEAFLAACEAWPAAHERIAPVERMDILGDAAGRIVFTAQQARVKRLAAIVESRLLLAALWARVQAQPGFETRMPARVRALRFDPDRASIDMDDGKPMTARLVVAADGADSWVRAQAGVEAHSSAYRQTAVVANFECEKAHHGTAYQWFQTSGVLALLPLAGQRCSMVWSAQQALAEELEGLRAPELCARVEAASHGVLGALRQITPAAGFPLRLVRVERMVAPRLALVGDAAHNLHPLAGQGVNVGFADARELADVLHRRGACADAGEYRLLRRYERARREDVLAMTLVTDGLQRLFNNDSRSLAWIRNRGLELVERSRPLKHLLARHALG